MPDIVVLAIFGGAMLAFAGVMLWVSQTSTGKPILRRDDPGSDRAGPAE